jgi:hypothetical protein
MTIHTYRRKPEVVGAIQWNGKNFEEIKKLYPSAINFNKVVAIKRSNGGFQSADMYDYIVKNQDTSETSDLEIYSEKYFKENFQVLFDGVFYDIED